MDNSISDLRNYVHRYIDNVDERTLTIIKNFIESDTQTIIAHSVDGKPLTIKHYFQILDEAEQRIANNEYSAQEEVEKEAENW